MAFNQILWSVQSRYVHLYPESAKVYIEKFQSIMKGYENLQEFIDYSSGHCNSSAFKEKVGSSLYLEAFCNGISAILQDFNHKFLAIEESFLSESSVSMLEIVDRCEHILSVLPCLNYAITQLKEGRYHGCKILDLCENLINCGFDVFRKLQQHCMRQFYKQTKLWITQAVLCDPYNEFFICSTEDEKTSLDSSVSSASFVGTSISGLSNNTGSPQFKVNPNNLPNMIPLSVATKMVFIGEALTICQSNEIDSKSNDRLLSICGISEESIVSQMTALELNEDFSLRDFSFLIDDLWIGVNKYIRQVSDEVGNVREQLLLMWEIYLLGRGELFQEFLVKGSNILTSDVTVVDSRNLNEAFKDAVYYVYLTENSELTDQFFFKLPHKRALIPGSPTWSKMELKCKIKWPLHYLFTPDVIHSYNRLFRFLLRLKKAQIDTTAWKNISSISNHSLRMELIEVRMYLLSVVGNLQNYCFTNVIANEMTILLETVKNTTMFTDLQKAVSLFLINISNRLFLSDNNPSHNSTSRLDKSVSVTSIETVFKCFKKIFSLCELFSELDGMNEENVFAKLTSIKSKLQSTLKCLFSLLQKIDQTYYCDGSNSTAHLYSLMMCLDYNGFFRSKFHLDSSE